MKKKFIAFMLAAFMLMSLSACAEKPAPATNNGTENSEKPQQETAPAQAGSDRIESLTIAISNDENTLAPFTYVSGTGKVVNRLIYDTLFTTNEENEIVPWMVEDDFEVDEDTKVFTLKLKEGQKFHDGSPVTAEDIKFSFLYPADQNVAELRKIAGKIESIDVLDELTMKFTLKETDINFMRDGFCVARIFPKALYENESDGTLVTESIGSGMYRLVEYKVGQYYKFEAVDDYFAGMPKVKTINMPIMEDSNAIQQAMLSGELASATSTIGVETLDVFESLDSMKVFASAGYRPSIMNINNGRYPLDQPEFRDALTYAIDVKGIMETLYGEYVHIGTRGLIQSDLPYAADGLDYVHDIEKANAILDKMGYTEKNTKGIRLDSNGDALSFEILVYSTNTGHIRTAEMMMEQLKAVGIELNINAMEMDTVDAYVWPDFEVSKGRDYDFSMWGWSSTLSMQYLITLCSSDFDIGTYNVCGYKNDEFDAIVSGDFKDVSNMEEMEKVLLELQEIVSKDPPLITFGYPDNLQVCNIDQYDGWVPVKGGNIINPYSFLP